VSLDEDESTLVSSRSNRKTIAKGTREQQNRKAEERSNNTLRKKTDADNRERRRLGNQMRMGWVTLEGELGKKPH
jgi:hypothetical protein